MSEPRILLPAVDRFRSVVILVFPFLATTATRQSDEANSTEENETNHKSRDSVVGKYKKPIASAIGLRDSNSRSNYYFLTSVDLVASVVAVEPLPPAAPLGLLVEGVVLPPQPIEITDKLRTRAKAMSFFMGKP